MAGSAICKALRKNRYGDTSMGGELLMPTRQELDLLDGEAVKNWYKINRPDIVILAAAKVGGIYANKTYPADFLLENLKIQTNVIEGAWKAGVRRLLFLGSSCIYPKFAEQPIKEDSLLTGALEPTNESYAIAKITGIKLCDSLRTQYGFDAISLMPTNLYGPGDNYHPQNCHVLPALIRRFHEAKHVGASSVTCWGTGAPLREFLHSEDLGEACVFVLENYKANKVEGDSNDNKKKSTSLLNVGSGEEVKISQLATQIAEVVQFEGKIYWDASMPDGTPRKNLDTNRLLQLGWKPKISLSAGIHQTYKDYLTSLEAK
ncbi:GDP-L-fucose synthase [Synechococcus sp. BIOS-U3-1]|nr:GDP-L-fucose synthase [Synechococcus sp. BIOS-U3-1]